MRDRIALQVLTAYGVDSAPRPDIAVRQPEIGGDSGRAVREFFERGGATRLVRETRFGKSHCRLELRSSAGRRLGEWARCRLCRGRAHSTSAQASARRSRHLDGRSDGDGSRRL